MESIDDKIFKQVKKQGRGVIFYSAEFTDIAEQKSVLKSFERLTKSGKIIRVARGIYSYPKIDKALGLGVLYPTLEEIAQSIARRDKARIVPTGIYALNRLGLSTQIPMNIVFLTDGSPRKIRVNNNQTILFKKTSPKQLSYKNELTMLLVFALKEISQDNLTKEHIDRIRELLKKEPKERILEDAALIPAWIKTIINKIYE